MWPPSRSVPFSCSDLDRETDCFACDKAAGLYCRDPKMSQCLKVALVIRRDVVEAGEERSDHACNRRMRNAQSEATGTEEK